MNRLIFREYDIRGIVEKDLTEEDVYLIARGFGSIVARKGGKVINTNCDGRPTSPAFIKAANKGLAECGLHVKTFGLGTTPMSYYAIEELHTDGAMMITASHNPKEYNGIKFTSKGGTPFSGEEIQDLYDLIEKRDFVKGEGSIEEIELKDSYINRMIDDLELGRELKIVWDNGNGAGGAILPELIKKIPGQHTVLYGEVDGTFPNHHPDPSEHKNLKDLQEKVIELGADVGFALDGDADRLGIVTNKGEIISNDLVLAIFAKEELKRHPGMSVVGDVKCSKYLFDKITEYGGKPIMWKTGNVVIKRKLQDDPSVVLGGEISGHIFFNKGFYGHDDAVYAAIKMINIVSNSEETLSDMLNAFPKTYCTPETRVEVSDEHKFEMVEQIQKSFEEKSEYDIVGIDGIRATGPDGIVMLRASNTQNALSIRCESLVGKEGLVRLVDLTIDELEKVDVKATRATFGV